MGELLSAPGVHDSDAEELPRTACSAVGGLGEPTAVISLETPNGPAPNWLTPRTWNVYFCPGVSPVTVRAGGRREPSLC